MIKDLKNIFSWKMTVFIFAGAAACGVLFYHWTATNQDFSEAFSAEISGWNGTEQKEIAPKPVKRAVKGIYLTAYSAGTAKKLNEIIDLIGRTELNAVVIDIKDYSGKILYDSDIKIVNDLSAESNQLGDVKKIIEKLHEHDIYVVARQTVFQDPLLARKKPEWAIKSKNGGLWRDYKGLSWVDPTREEVWDYNLAIAKEAIAFGFDEINFDYMRFPSDGNMSAVVYTHKENTRYEAMRKFYEFLSEGLKDEPAWISVDMFGLVMEAKGESWDMNIGQRVVDAVDNFDYICPMMYPSHYPSGHLGFFNPAEHPSAVIENGMKMGIKFFEGKRAEVRPWLQAFNIGAVYDGAKIRAEIDATEKYSDAGWFLWNASNRYTSAGLKAE